MRASFGCTADVSDPLLALRILYNALRPGGVLLVETATPGAGRRSSDGENGEEVWTAITPSSLSASAVSSGRSGGGGAAVEEMVPPERLVDYHAGGENSASANNFYLPS